MYAFGYVSFWPFWVRICMLHKMAPFYFQGTNACITTFCSVLLSEERVYYCVTCHWNEHFNGMLCNCFAQHDTAQALIASGAYNSIWWIYDSISWAHDIYQKKKKKTPCPFRDSVQPRIQLQYNILQSTKYHKFTINPKKKAHFFANASQFLLSWNLLDRIDRKLAKFH